ncbi:hypothetical protein CCACVL1_19183 [Corchorus capsularis]|uniref:Uncharacterized protein n=1 Tax=Corchorus capsularis TaxID=210143 RepID=A0A1R3HHZ8_COCAP|nr:hypothetical protein CCACVL1_19183 [Corchorus capsularis]
MVPLAIKAYEAKGALVISPKFKLHDSAANFLPEPDPKTPLEDPGPYANAI